MQPLWKNAVALSLSAFAVTCATGIDAGALHAPTAVGRLRGKESALFQHRRKSKAPSWGYGDLGGSGWVNAGYARCALKDQSPVDLSHMSGRAEPNATKLFYRYRPYTRAMPLFNDGRLVAWTAQEWRQEEIGHLAMGAEYPHDLTEYYSLFQAVIHTPSEHTFGGVRVPLELQLYHRKMEMIDGFPGEVAEGVAVVSIGFEEAPAGKNANALLSALGSHGAPMDTGDEVLGNNDGNGIDFSSLFKKDANDGAGTGEDLQFMQYEGSLTTPPCDTGIKWFIRPDALPASHKVLETFRAAADAVAGARDAGAGNARSLQKIGDRVALWVETADATPLRTPHEVHQAMDTNIAPRQQTADAPEEGLETEVAPVVAAPAGGDASAPVTEDGGPVEAEPDSPQACQVNFAPSDVGAILCCWSAPAIETSPDIIISRNGAYIEAQNEAAKVEKDLADAENHKNEQCAAKEEAVKAAESASPGQEAVEANQKASTYTAGCEEGTKMVTDLSNQKASWDSKVMAVRGQIEATLSKAREELKNAVGGFACTQESVEVTVPKAAEMDPGSATVDIAHSFPRHLAPGNPKLVAGSDSGLVEMQFPKQRHPELK